jgi:structural maintenance of chromosome 4
LGDLGTIHDKYDVAVTTACGALDNIVVETVEAGQKCIEFLKKQSLGRATFICLDKLRKWDLSPLDTPEQAPRLFDLITPKEPRFALAFYQVLQNTLVAKDLEQANRIAYGKTRYRVVTLDGKLIDTSGTMSGGGSKPQKGGMNSKSIDQEITEEKVVHLEKCREKQEQDLMLVTEHYQELRKDLALTESDFKSVDGETTRLTMDIESVERLLKDALQHLKELQ